MKLIYMGTPDIAVPALNALHEGGHEILAAVTQPDRPKGRGKALGEPPVKTAARALGIPVLQPERVKKNEELLETLKGLSPDVIVVMAFGQILPGEILTLPRYGCVNIHASLLPRYRGAAPIQWAVIDGEKETGLTTMYMSEGLDTGDMLLKTVVPIDKDETGGSLHDKLAKAAGPLILKTLEGLEEGTITPVPQEGESSYASMLTKEMGHIDWTKDAAVIERLIRGLSPWPGAYTVLGGKTLKLWRTEVASFPESGEAPGTVTACGKEGLFVQTGNGVLAIRELQLSGKKRMDAAAFLRGFSVKAGERLE